MESFTDISGYGVMEPEHDAAGNLIFDGASKYTYDACNRLIMEHQAYKDPSVASGALQTGSTLGEYA